MSLTDVAIVIVTTCIVITLSAITVLAIRDFRRVHRFRQRMEARHKAESDKATARMERAYAVISQLSQDANKSVSRDKRSN